jgi:D-3-phosphoglycerate dehydrogenase / 2-oxoglutarate reductase
MPRHSLDKDRIRFLLLEGVHPAAATTLNRAGYHLIDERTGSLTEEDLIAAIRDVHFIGIRSRTRLNAEVLATADKLVGIGCFCIGTNQVDLEAAALRGIPVFNAPFSNTRSVAELVLGEVLLLLRGVPEKNALAHRGVWRKSAAAAFEARSKNLGIVGYGHIGTQLGILAENIGMNVYYHDIVGKLALGTATPCADLDELLSLSDAVCLHVPETERTCGMIGADQLARMRPGAVLVNASRGSVVDIDALVKALDDGRLAGAALDVFPHEPKTNDEEFVSPLRRFDNVLLTPHVGGSTVEAQENIGKEVAEKLVTWSDNGSTLSAVNFPEVALPPHTRGCRLLHIHHNRPGILQHINHAFGTEGLNIAAQYLQTTTAIGYVVMDVETAHSDLALAKLKDIPGTIRARILY